MRDSLVLISYKSAVPLLAFIPLLVTSVYYGVTAQNTTTNPTLETTEAAERQSRNFNLDNGDGAEYFLTLKSGTGVVPIYERKGTFALSSDFVWGWGHNGIPIDGSITNYPLNQADLIRRTVLIEAEQNDELIFKKFVTTDRDGKFHGIFFPPTSGSIKVIAMMVGDNSTESVITVIVTESALPIMVIALLIVIALALITVSESIKPKKKWKWVVLVFVAILTTISYIVLFKFPPFDEAGNTAFAAALLAPLAAYFYKVATEPEPPAVVDR
jgi:hypothetical protein